MDTSASVIRVNPEIWLKGPLGNGTAIARSARDWPTSRGLELLEGTIAARPEPVFVIEATDRLVIRNPAAAATFVRGP